jgi:hypothetical protein
MQCQRSQRRRSNLRRRRGAATLDYVLVLGVILPLATFILGIGPRMMRLVYDMICVLTAWPFV